MRIISIWFTWHIWSTYNTNQKLTSLANSFAKDLRITDTESDLLVDPEINMISKKVNNRISLVTGSGITLTNHEKKEIIKVIKPLENRGISLKETTRKIASQ